MCDFVSIYVSINVNNVFSDIRLKISYIILLMTLFSILPIKLNRSLVNKIVAMKATALSHSLAIFIATSTTIHARHENTNEGSHNL